MKEARRSRRYESIVDLFIRTGMSKNIAKTLVVLSKRDETTSVDIEKATGLRQPEVSIAMQDLRHRRWVEKRDIKEEGKGRPVHAYRLAVPFSAIVDAIAKAERRKIERVQGIIRRLKRRAARTGRWPTRRPAGPKNKPFSITPGTLLISRSSLSGFGIGPNLQSTTWFPLSVRYGTPPAMRRTAVQ